MKDCTCKNQATPPMQRTCPVHGHLIRSVEDEPLRSAPKQPDNAREWTVLEIPHSCMADLFAGSELLAHMPVNAAKRVADAHNKQVQPDNKEEKMREALEAIRARAFPYLRNLEAPDMHFIHNTADAALSSSEASG